MKRRNRRIKHERGRRISVYIKKDVSDELLMWLNNQADVGPSIIDVLEKYVKDELISVDVLRRIQVSNEEGSSKRKFDMEEEEVVKTLKTKPIDDVLTIAEEDEVAENVIINREEVFSKDHETKESKESHLIGNKKDNNKDRPPLVQDFNFLSGEGVKKSRFGDKK